MSVTHRRFIAERIVEVIDEIRCDRCKVLLENQHPGTDIKMPRDASQVVMSGHYGGFLDMEVLAVDLCKDCSQGLLDWLGIRRAAWDDEDRHEAWKHVL